jgi:hypothetical protein
MEYAEVERRTPAGHGLKWTVRPRQPRQAQAERREEIADFLCRPVSEVHDKIVELGRSGELERRVAETAKGAGDQYRVRLLLAKP